MTVTVYGVEAALQQNRERSGGQNSGATAMKTSAATPGAVAPSQAPGSPATSRSSTYTATASAAITAQDDGGPGDDRRLGQPNVARRYPSTR